MSFTLRLVLLIVLSAVPVLSLQILDELQQRREQQVEAEHDVRRIAELTARYIDGKFEAAQYMLASLAQLPEIRDADAAGCAARLNDLRGEFPAIIRLAVVDPSGRIFCSSEADAVGVWVGDRDYIQQVMRTGRPAHSDLIISRSGAEPLVVIAYPAFEEGRIAAVVIAGYDVQALSVEIRPRDLPDDAVIQLIDGQGRIAAQNPGNFGPIGLEIERHIRRRQRDDLPPDSFEAVDVQGVQRIYGVATLDRAPNFHTMVGLSRDALFARADTLLREDVASIMAGFALAGAAAWAVGYYFMQRPMRALASRLNDVAAGRLDTQVRPVRFEIPEFRSLAASFNAMAQALRVRERQLRESERQAWQRLVELESIYDGAPIGIALLDRDLRYVRVNRTLAEMNDLPIEAHVGRTTREVVPAVADQTEASLRQIFETGEPIKNREIRMEPRPGSEERPRAWIENVVPIRDESGRIIMALGCVIEITERKEMEERQALLAAELDHRAKNLLATVQAMARLMNSDSIDAFKHAFQGRIQALARAHSLLSASRWSSVEIAALVAEELAPYVGSGGAVLRASGPRVGLRPKAAQALAMLLHELGTNAVKYGALSVADGVVEVGWEHQGGVLVLTWQESGGPPVHAPQRRGFGTLLVEYLLEQDLGGRVELSFPESGVACRVEIPSRQLAAETAAESIREAKESPAETKSRSPHVQGLRVLVVEDETLVALELSDILERLGCHVVGPARSVVDAARLLGTERVDAALVDFNLGEETSLSLGPMLRARGIPYAHCTGYGTRILEGADETVHLVPKPYEPSAIAEALSRLQGLRVDVA